MLPCAFSGQKHALAHAVQVKHDQNYGLRKEPPLDEKYIILGYGTIETHQSHKMAQTCIFLRLNE